MRAAEEDYLRKMQEAAQAVAMVGYVTNVYNGYERDGWKMDLHVTVGLWASGFPELMCFGPIDMSQEDLRHVAHVYVSRGEKPQHGDQVLVNNRRLYVKQIFETKDVAQYFEHSVGLSQMYADLYVEDWPPFGFQVHGDIEPPVRLWKTPVTQSRTLASEEDYDAHTLAMRLVRMRKESQRLWAEAKLIASGAA